MRASSDPRSVTEVDRQIGARLRARREELGFSLVYVSDALGIAFQQLNKYELGKNRIAASMLMRLADILRADPAHFLYGARAPKPPRQPQEDALAAQLQLAFSRIKSPQERRLVLELARRFSSTELAKTPTPKKAKPRH